MGHGERNQREWLKGGGGGGRKMELQLELWGRRLGAGARVSVSVGARLCHSLPMTFILERGKCDFGRNEPSQHYG